MNEYIEQTNDKKSNDINTVLDLACQLGCITREELSSLSRRRMIGDIRVCCGNILRKVFNLSQEEAGRYLNRDHASIHHYEAQHSRMMKFNYYKNIFNSCVSVAMDSSAKVDVNTLNRYADITKLKESNKRLRETIKTLKKELEQYSKIKENILKLAVV